MKWTDSKKDTKLSKLNQEGHTYIHTPITRKEFELVILKLPAKKSPDSDVFSEFYQMF